MKMRDIHRMIRKSTATIRTDAARTTITNTTSILILAIYLNLVEETCGVKLTNMSAPNIQDPRSDMTLDCHFDMGKDILYAVKWYKDEQEFFRFMPHQQPHMVSYPVAGIHMVPQLNSCGETSCKVHLTGLSRDHSGGSYRCEISTEAPTFRLASETRNVTIAVLPYENPKIENLSDSYNYGDIIQTTCVSSPADPTPILNWYINNEEAPSNMVGESISTNPDNQGLASRSISLRLQVDRKNALGNIIQLKCVSILPGIPIHPQIVTRNIAIRNNSGSSSSSSGSSGNHNDGNGSGITIQQTQVNNEKLHWPSSSASTTTITIACNRLPKRDRIMFVLFALGVSWWLH